MDSDGEVRYVGRTQDYDRRMKEHERPGGKIQEYNLKPGKFVLRNLTKEQARGLEQTLMVFYHTKNLMKDPEVPYYNFMNGIANTNLNKTAYYKATKEYITKYPSLFENILEERNAVMEEMGAWW
ncbi:MAG: GIY-YIG nuclease family protein [Lachnospiraceae bacterium]|nr:GIY-YIG nuclease family protein [Lachnospiraceae bacterium]